MAAKGRVIITSNRLLHDFLELELHGTDVTLYDRDQDPAANSLVVGGDRLLEVDAPLRPETLLRSVTLANLVIGTNYKSFEIKWLYILRPISMVI